jgi:PAS domain S-box-containing protein
MSDLSTILINDSTNLVVVLNPDTSIDYVSPSSLAIVGYESNQLLGEGWWKLTKKDVSTSNQIRKELVNNVTQRIFEREIINAKGETVWMLWKTSVTKENKIVALGFDITSSKLQELEQEKEDRLQLTKTKEIFESIEYAGAIQKSILADINKAKNYVSDAFALFKPKDVVSGDFIWSYDDGDEYIVAVIDCTGHGVPGALVSIMANAALNDIVANQKVRKPSEILTLLDAQITKTLNERSSVTRFEGMDIALINYNKSTRSLSFSGAYRPLILIRNNEIIEYEGNKNPIGYFFGFEKRFDDKILLLEEGDTIYLFTDGYTDQFGGENVKKFNRNRFRSLLISLQSFSLEKQQEELQLAFESWKGKSEQIDDVTVVGLRI